MASHMEPDQWVWVVVQDPGKEEQFLGQVDEQRQLSFVPAFLDKKAAETGMGFLALRPEHDYEVQAIQAGDLLERVKTHGFGVLVLGPEGEVLQEIR